MLRLRNSRARTRSTAVKEDSADDQPKDCPEPPQRRVVSCYVPSSGGHEDWGEPIIRVASDCDSNPGKNTAPGQSQQQQGGGSGNETKKKKKKKPAIFGFFKRIRLWRRRSRSRSRGRHQRQKSPSSPRGRIDAPDGHAVVGRPGAYDLRLIAAHGSGRAVLSATALASVPLDPWGCPYDFAVQNDRLLVPGLEVAEFSLGVGGRQGPSVWPARLGCYVPLCIDVTPGLVYLTAACPIRCGLFVFDRAGRIAASRLQSTDAAAAAAASAAAPNVPPGAPQRRPGMFAVRVNFRGECWVTNPRDLCVDHYTAALKRIRSIDVARFGVPYYLAAHGHQLVCLWVSFPESRRVVKFDWLTLEPLCHLAFGAGQSPCGLHLDERSGQLFVTDIGGGRVLVYHAATMGLAAGSTRAANAAVAARSTRPAAVRLSGGRLFLLTCSAADGGSRIDIYDLAFGEEGGDVGVIGQRSTL